MKPVYFDHAATTGLSTGAMAAMLPYFSETYGNPSSLHSFGRAARQGCARAREQLARLLGTEPAEVFFTSGGSESDNWAVKGLAWANRSRGRHLVTTAVEHHAVLNACHWLEHQGFEITYLPVDGAARVSPEAVAGALREDTVLVSVMAANNEVGTLEPIEAIGSLLQERGILFHTDAVQAVGHIPLDMKQLPVDALSLSGHKFYGPKGIGALYLRQGTKIESWIHGGSQERGLRAGTENTAGIVGLGAAAAEAEEAMAGEMVRLQQLRQRLEQGILALPGAWINGAAAERLPGHLSFGLTGVTSEVLLIRLDLAGFALSAGSACSAGSIEPSHVLTAMGQPMEKANGTVRVSLGRENTLQEVEDFLAALRQIAAAVPTAAL